MVAADFEAYSDKQEQVEDAFRSRKDWAQLAVLNTAQLGWFSSDRAIRTYNREIWKADTD